jgi:hypothetical protein
MQNYLGNYFSSTIIGMLDVAIRFGGFPSFLHGRGELLEHLFGVFPADASISDTDAILEASFAFFRNLLTSCVVVSQGTVSERGSVTYLR